MNDPRRELTVQSRKDYSDAKESVGTVFRNITSKASDTVSSISEFLSEVGPYLKYFFPDNDKMDFPGTFFHDTVEVSRKNMMHSIEQAVKVMNEDSAVHSAISDSIGKVDFLSGSVSTILGYLDLIEMYSVNTMIISARSGDIGISLATISGKMSSLSRQGAELGAEFSGIMKKLVDVSGEFISIKSGIDALHESYLTNLQLMSGENYRKFVGSMHSMSSLVNRDFAVLRNVKEKLDSIIVNYQLEDLVRQNLEKLIYLSDYVLAAEDEDFDFYFRLSSGRLSCLKNSIDVFHETMSGIFSDLAASYDSFKLNYDSDAALGEKKTITLIWDRINGMKKEYTDYIDRILDKKIRLRQIALEVESNMDRFGAFYKKLTDIAKNFERILLLTRIELARHDELKRSLEGSLSDVSDLPQKIKDEVESALENYSETYSQLKKSIADNNKSFEPQKNILEGCSDSIKKMTVNVDESRNYHRQFEEKMFHYFSILKKQLVEDETSYREFLTVRDSISNCLDSFNSMTGKTDEPEVFEKKMGRMKRSILESGESESYESAMLLSLLSEHGNENSSDAGSIEFF